MDALQMLLMGTNKEAHGRQWQVIQSFGNGQYLAIEKGVKPPVPVHFIVVDSERTIKV